MEDGNIISIHDRDKSISDNAFKELMCKTQSFMNQEAKTTAFAKVYKECSASEMESYSLKAIQEVCGSSPFRREDIKLVSAQYFPDIVAGKYYGVEVKTTRQNHWTSTGSSIVENTRDKNVELIYMLFCKQGGDCAEVLCKPYEQCLSNIAVTHSPRYLINMELKPEDTIFSKMNISYDELRLSADSIEKVRNYFKREAIRKNKYEMPWWIGSNNSLEETAMNVTLWSDQSIESKKFLTSLMFILFPDILEHRYQQAALWLCTHKSIVNPNIRDCFSASGNCECRFHGSLIINIPKIILTLQNQWNSIQSILTDRLLFESAFFDINEFRPEIIQLSSNARFDFWRNNCIEQIKMLPNFRMLSIMTNAEFISLLENKSFKPKLSR